MTRALPLYGFCALLGLLGGAFGGWTLISSGLFNGDPVGPWTTGVDYGSKDASPLTRAAVARHGILALPAREARYFGASVDSAGRPLSGDCRYRMSGEDLGGAWWSVTAYGADGFLMENDAGRYSVPNRLASPEGGRWTFEIGAQPAEGTWLPVIAGEPFSLILRVYVPEDGSSETLPTIERLGCSA